jgi:hypothetical protein
MSSPDHAGRKPVAFTAESGQRIDARMLANGGSVELISQWRHSRVTLRRRVLLLCALAVLAVVIVIAASLPAVAQVPVERIGEPPAPVVTAIPLKPPCQTARCVHLPIVKRGAR